jgi:hypothetical protein
MTSHPPAAKALRNGCRCCHPRHLLMLTLTSHPPAATASCDGCRRCRPCLCPCRRLMLTLNPTATTALCNCLHPCIPSRRRSTSCVNVNVASYRRQRHARSSLLSSSPCLSLSPPPVNVAHRRCILPPPPPRTIVVVFVVPVLVPVPAACRHRPSTSHPPAATAMRDLCRFCHPRPRPCPRRLLPPVDVTHPRCIVLPPLPCTIIVVVVVPVACQR